LIVKKGDTPMRFTTIFPTTRNFTPSDLMNDYAKLNPRATFARDQYFNAYLLIAGTRYYYDHYKIENGSDDGSIAVTVYLKEKTA
jgi:hypothetical protein